MPQAAIYTRYSSDRQRETSLEDQAHACNARAESEGWTVAKVYADAAISGARQDRPQYQAMLAEAGRDWHILLVEDLSRLSRDEVEGVQSVRRLEHRGVRVIGVSDGYDSDRPGRTAQRSVRALLSALYLEDLAHRTHRGQEGQVRRGYRAGGLPYGYRPVRDDRGSKLEIDQDQAAVVRRIWTDFAAGRSPRRIASDLNADAIAPPRSSNRKGPPSWISSVLYGHPAKGTGILRNPIYQGQVVWNRSKWDKDPDTGKRVRRERPESEWITADAPELRIIDAALAARVERRHAAIAAASARARSVMGNAGRTGPAPRHLFSGLMVCGACGAPWVTVNRERYGCSAARYRGESVCSVRRTVMRSVLEDRLLGFIREDMASPEAIAAYRAELIAEVRRLSAAAAPDLNAAHRKLADLDGRIANMIEMIAAGTRSKALQTALEGAEVERATILRKIDASTASARVVPLPADIEALYRAQLEDLSAALAEDTDAAREILRELVGEVSIHARENALEAHITGTYQGVEYANFGSGGRILKIACKPVVIML